MVVEAPLIRTENFRYFPKKGKSPKRRKWLSSRQQYSCVFEKIYRTNVWTNKFDVNNSWTNEWTELFCVENFRTNEQVNIFAHQFFRMIENRTSLIFLLFGYLNSPTNCTNQLLYLNIWDLFVFQKILLLPFDVRILTNIRKSTNISNYLNNYLIKLFNSYFEYIRSSTTIVSNMCSSSPEACFAHSLCVYISSSDRCAHLATTNLTILSNERRFPLKSVLATQWDS